MNQPTQADRLRSQDHRFDDPDIRARLSEWFFRRWVADNAVSYAALRIRQAAGQDATDDVTDERDR